MRITILGDGGWGTTLALVLSGKNYPVTLWGAFPGYTALLDKERVNNKFLPGIPIPKSIKITGDLHEAVCDKELIVLAVPSQHMRNIVRSLKKTRHNKKCVYLSVAKGIEINSLKRMSEVIHDELGPVKFAVLSGPTIAHEVAVGVPTTAVIACHDKTIRKSLQDIFMTENLRIYTNDDVIGVELGGSLKNVIAIACGISDGLGFGANTKAAILSRGLVEISRMGTGLGAKASTFSGISGLGDLVTTCISDYSRNRFVGEQIGKGKTLSQIRSRMQMVAEGIPTTKSAYQLSIRHKICMPIAKEVYSVLYKNKSARKAVRDLMTRQKKEE